MNALKPCKTIVLHSSFLSHYSIDIRIRNLNVSLKARRTTKFALKASVDGQEEKKTSERQSFLTLEEAGLVEMSGLSSHERFLCRLTVFLNFWLSIYKYFLH